MVKSKCCRCSAVAAAAYPCFVRNSCKWWCPGIRTFPKRIQSSLLPPCYSKNINLKLNKENRESYYLSKLPAGLKLRVWGNTSIEIFEILSTS